MKVHDNSLDVVRCISNYMIVVLHAWAAFQYVPWGCGEFIVWTVICSHVMNLAMPAFFLISGYLLFQRFSLSAYPMKMKRRVSRLVVPYIAWNTVFVMFYLLLFRFVPRLSARVASFGLDSFSGALSKVISLTVPPIDGPLWFLRVLFLFSLASPLLWYAMRFCRGYILLGATLVWCVLEGCLGVREYLIITAPSYALVCFVLGGVIATNGKDLLRVFRSRLWILIGVSACLIRAGIEIPVLCANARLNFQLGILSSLLLVLEAPVLISAASILPVDRILTNKVYGLMKEMSFFAYAGHFLFCSIFLHSLAPLLGWMQTGKMTLLVSVFVLCGVPTMAVVYWCGKKVFPKIMRVFDGTL